MPDTKLSSLLNRGNRYQKVGKAISNTTIIKS